MKILKFESSYSIYGVTIYAIIVFRILEQCMSNFESLLFYIGFYLISAISFAYSKNTQSIFHQKIFFSLAFFIPIFIAGLRYNVGTDFQTYSAIYDICVGTSIKDIGTIKYAIGAGGYGLLVICRLISIFGSPISFFFTFAFLICLFFNLGLKDYEDCDYYIAYFAFLMSTFTVGLNIMKQIVAICILFYAMKYAYQKQIIKFILLVLLASSIHIISLLFIPVYILFDKYDESEERIFSLNVKSKITPVVFFVGSAGVGLLIDKLLVLLTNIPIFANSFLSGYVAEVDGRNLSFILSFLVFVLLVLLQDGFVYEKPVTVVLLVMVAIGTGLEATGFFSAYVKRIGMFYSSIPSIILLSYLPKCFTKDSRGIVRVLVSAYEIIVFVLQYYILGQSQIIPYSFI